MIWLLLLLVLQQLPALSSHSLVSSLQPEDCKNRNGDKSSTVRVAVDLEAPGKGFSCSFIAKLLPNDGPCGVYCFKASSFEKETSNYFQMLPTLQQACLGQHGSDNMDGTRVPVFEYTLQQGVIHPKDPKSLSREQLLPAVSLTVKVSTSHKQKF